MGADARLIEEAALAAVEAALTGASVPVAATFRWFLWPHTAGALYDNVRTETFTVLAVL